MAAPDVGLAERYRLRARLRDVTSSTREQDCGMRCVQREGVTVLAHRKPGAEMWMAQWRGVLTCGHVWTCAVCSARLRAERLSRLVRAMVNGRGRWQMLTVTIAHQQHHRLKTTLDGLVRSWRLCRQGRPIQPIWSALVSGSARTFEVTHGKHGWHPHAHVLLRTEEWSLAARQALYDRFAVMVDRELGPEHVPSREHGLRWSKPLPLGVAGGGAAVDGDAKRVAHYLAKLGLELTGHGKDGSAGKKPLRGRSHWEVARAAADGAERDVHLWREFQRGTFGKRMIELDRRAGGFAQQVTEPATARESPELEVREFKVRENLFPVLRIVERTRPGVLADVLVLSGPDPEAAFHDAARALIRSVAVSVVV